jgi:hypothetical protein
MKHVLTLTLALCVTAAVAQIRTPAASPGATVAQVIGVGKVTVDYARPSLKGRKMFGDQIPYGKVWRTGANRTTRLTITEPVTMGGQAVRAGSFGLFTIPGKTDWIIILSKDSIGPGAFAYKEANDLLRFTVKAVKSAPTETFTIEFTESTPTSANLSIRWEDVTVNIPVINNPDAQIMAQIAEQTAKPDANPGVYYAAANYYLETNRDLKVALEWANKVVDKSKEYWTYNLRAKIEAKLGQCPAARTDAMASQELNLKGNNDDAYTKANERVLAQCK